MDLYKTALNYYEKGFLNEAQSSLKELLQQDDSDPDTWNFLGIISLKKNNLSEAKEYFHNCIYLSPFNGMAYYNLGLCYHRLDDIPTALRTYEIAKNYLPENTDLLLNIAVIQNKLNKPEQAEKIYYRILALEPGNSEALNNLANIKMSKGDVDEAVSIFTQAISASPENYNLYYNLGNCYMSSGDYENAEHFFTKTISLNENHFESLNNLGVLYTKMSEYKKAEETYKKLLLHYPDNDKTYFNLASCYNSMESPEKAIEYYNKAYELNPDSKGALINLGNIYNAKGEIEKCNALFNMAVSDPNLQAITLTNIGISVYGQGMFQDALGYFNQSLALSPFQAETHYNISHLLLLQGNFEEGWEKYEWRFKRKDNQPRNFNNPLLKGTNISGKKILVLHEQGLGDNIQFVRYLKLLKESGAYIIYECDIRLYPLFERLLFVDKLIIYNNYNIEEIEYDYFTHLMSLPFILGINSYKIADNNSYLSADPNYLIKWKTILPDNDQFKVGIVWSGNPKHTGDKKRSCPLKHFVPLFETNCTIYSLQKNFGLDQLEDFLLPVINLDSYIQSFEDTAAAVLQLDLIITVDTSVAHLAGALGKEVWLLLPAVPDWRWMLNTIDTPWYSSMKIYRQKSPGNWNSVFSKMAEDLNKILMKRPKEKGFIDSPDTVYLGLAKGDNFGWGICSMYLKKELSKFVKTVNIDEHLELLELKELKGKVFHALTDVQFCSLYLIKGGKNIGYTFFENEIPPSSLKTANEYDLILAGSTWCRDKMKNAGIENTDILIQGIDHDLFFPSENKDSSLFKIFSGGKFEYRNGQDIVLKAFKYMQQKYDDVVLINAWYNLWPSSMLSMSRSPHITFDLKGNTWKEFMENIYLLNGLDTSRIITLPLVPNSKLRELYIKTDIGVFPNRCEGGTNQILMEYMACGKTPIATYTGGHKDVLSEENSLLLKDLKECKIYDNNNTLVSDWEEASLDELIYLIEYAYFHRDEINKKGEKASEDMKYFTWERSAKSLLNYLNA